MVGNPVFRGTRVPVHMLAELVPSRVRARTRYRRGSVTSCRTSIRRAKEITARAPGQDPLGYGWDREIVPLPKSNSGLWSVAIFEGIRRRHPEDRRRRPRTLERRIRAWR